MALSVTSPLGHGWIWFAYTIHVACYKIFEWCMNMGCYIVYNVDIDISHNNMHLYHYIHPLYLWYQTIGECLCSLYWLHFIYRGEKMVTLGSMYWSIVHVAMFVR
jgi:hypothetical protein